MTKLSVEAALNAELDHHFDYGKGTPKVSANTRNGYTVRTLKTEEGAFELNTSRDRGGEFESQLMK